MNKLLEQMYYRLCLPIHSTNVKLTKCSYAAYNTTVMFSERGGNWEEALVLDKSYMSYQLSGRQMLTTGFYRVLHEDKDPTFHHEVYALNIEECTQSMPTQMPSLSQSPTAFVPCYPVEIAVTFGFSPGSSGWHITRLDGPGSGDDFVVKSYKGAWNDLSQSRAWYVCLPEGEYQFTVYNNEGKSTIPTWKCDSIWLGLHNIFDTACKLEQVMGYAAVCQEMGDIM